MGFLNMLSDFTSDDFLDNALGKLEQGLDSVETAIAGGIDRADEVTSKLEQGAEKVIDTADKAIESTNKLAE